MKNVVARCGPQALRRFAVAQRRCLSYQMLSPDELADAQTKLSGWSLVDGDERTALSKTFQFDDFVQAWSFMSKIALKVGLACSFKVGSCVFVRENSFMQCISFQAEKMDHHPEWSNVYNTVSIQLTSHDSIPQGNQVTVKDTTLASFCDSAASGN